MRTAISLALVLALAGSACAANATVSRGTSDGKLTVVVAESFWASIAAQLGGDRVHVTSIISSPDTDPHEFEPTPSDARAVASAQYVVFNGLGYDQWMREMLDANDASGRRVLEVGALLHLASDDNPHRWYFPSDVEQVIDQMSADFAALAPADAAYFAQLRAAFLSNGLARYHELLAEITRRFAGAPVAASESIFEGIAEATHLDLTTPRSFLSAVSEGTDPPARDKKRVDEQLSSHSVRVFVYNQQNAMPDVVALVREADAAGVPAVTISETPPEGVSFQDWQAEQLQALLTALSRTPGS